MEKKSVTKRHLTLIHNQDQPLSWVTPATPSALDPHGLNQLLDTLTTYEPLPEPVSLATWTLPPKSTA